MKKPHVCFVSESKATYGLLVGGESSSTVGGAEVQQTLLASALVKLGYALTFLVPDLGQPDKVVTDEGITLIKTREQYKGSGLRQNIDDFRLIFRAMNRANADIYYEMTSCPITGVVGVYCKLKRKPFVYSVASNMDLDGTVRTMMKPHHHALYWYGMSKATVIVVQTQDQVQMLKENVGREGVLITSTFSEPTEEEKNTKKEYVLWVGSYREVRRPDMMINLAAGLPQYRFVMVGGACKGQEAMYEEMRDMAKSVPNLTVTGPVPYQEVGKYFAGAKLFVNTSSNEGFPNTYMQAWARGVPVIGTFDADNLITGYGLGEFCSTPNELSAAVTQFMEDDARRIAVGEAGIRYVHDHHGIDVVAGMYDKLFMQLHQE